MILPGAAYTEKNGTYVNTEGRVQRGFRRAIRRARRARTGRSCARSAQAIGQTLPYDDLEALRARLEQVNPVFGRVGFLPRFGCTDTTGPAGDPAVLSATRRSCRRWPTTTRPIRSAAPARPWPRAPSHAARRSRWRRSSAMDDFF